MDKTSLKHTAAIVTAMSGLAVAVVTSINASDVTSKTEKGMDQAYLVMIEGYKHLGDQVESLSSQVHDLRERLRESEKRLRKRNKKRKKPVDVKVDDKPKLIEDASLTGKPWSQMALPPTRGAIE